MSAKGAKLTHPRVSDVYTAYAFLFQTHRIPRRFPRNKGSGVPRSWFLPRLALQQRHRESLVYICTCCHRSESAKMPVNAQKTALEITPVLTNLQVLSFTRFPSFLRNAMAKITKTNLVSATRSPLKAEIEMAVCSSPGDVLLPGEVLLAVAFQSRH